MEVIKDSVMRETEPDIKSVLRTRGFRFPLTTAFTPIHCAVSDRGLSQGGNRLASLAKQRLTSEVITMENRRASDPYNRGHSVQESKYTDK
jgi:hypothetical protein